MLAAFFTTRDLALYGAIVGTLGGVWTLYVSVILDRARVRLSVAEGVSLDPATQHRTEIIMVRVSNRGRRGTSVQSISRVVQARRDRHEISRDIMEQLATPLRLGEGEGRTLVHGQQGGHQRGQMPLRRWYLTDGAGRKYPLRERWRQRVERVVFWPWRRSAR